MNNLGFDEEINDDFTQPIESQLSLGSNDFETNSFNAANPMFAPPRIAVSYGQVQPGASVFLNSKQQATPEIQFSNPTQIIHPNMASQLHSGGTKIVVGADNKPRIIMSHNADSRQQVDLYGQRKDSMANFGLGTIREMGPMNNVMMIQTLPNHMKTETFNGWVSGSEIQGPVRPSILSNNTLPPHSSLTNAPNTFAASTSSPPVVSTSLVDPSSASTSLLPPPHLSTELSSLNAAPPWGVPSPNMQLLNPAAVATYQPQTLVGGPGLNGGGTGPFMKSIPSPSLSSPVAKTSPLIGGAGLAPFDFNFATLSSEILKSESYKGAKSYVPKEERLQEDATAEEEETLTHAETFANYQPAKLRIGQPHPDSVVETSSLSSVQPPKIWYELVLPDATIDSGALSALQLEAIVYSCQRHERILANGERAGFLIGDGAGVGKGRTIAGIIFENYLLERKKALWVSVSNDLKYDAARDLKDIGAIDIPVYSLNKFKYAKISSKENSSVKKGVIFSTYSSLISESSSRTNKMKSRLKQLVHWFKSDFDGCIIFDECHRAKNLVPTGGSKPTKTGQVVLEIQRLLPKARVVYASATGASEPKNMAYMTRLGLWGPGTPFSDFNQFIAAVERRGVGAMEIVAMDMKLRGMYLARQLSFSGVTFKIEEVPLSSEFEKMYNESVALWVRAREYFGKAISYCTEDDNNRSSKMLWGQFWSSHQRFFKYLCIASKVKRIVCISRQALKNGKCVVIGLQSTGEARTMEQIEAQGATQPGDSLEDFVSTAKGVFQSLIERHFPTFDNGFGSDDGWGNVPLTLQSSTIKQNTSNSKPKKRIRSSGFGSDDDVNSDYERNFLENDEFDSDVDKFSDHGMSNSGSENDREDDEFDENDVDDVNPFAVGNNSDEEDDCPWLKKSVKSSKNASNKKPQKQKRKREENEADFMGSCNSLTKKPRRKDNTPSSLSGQSSLGIVQSSRTKLSNSSLNNPVEAAKLCSAMRNELLSMLDRLESSLPANTLDQLIDDLGGTENVAEMTGRKGRVVSNDAGNIQYEKRSETLVPLEVINVTEKKRFMDLEKRVAIISEAASSGISLQADRRAKNQLRRIHITMELPWSADRAVQQFGRTHRSNQVHAPEYLLVISALAGERRFASIVAKRLECLGALTHGDRRATETQDLSSFNIDNKYGRHALEDVYQSILSAEPGKVAPPKSYKGPDFYKDMQRCLVDVGLCEKSHSGHLVLDKDAMTISKFLNRILGMPVKHQNALFEHFTNTLEAIVLEEKKLGKFDLGILDLGKNGESITKRRIETFQSEFQDRTYSELHEVLVERGVSFEDALAKFSSMNGEVEGFYVDKQVHGAQRKVVLVTALRMSNKKVLYTLTRPNVGTLAKLETEESIGESLKKVDANEAKPLWNKLHERSQSVCSHQMYHGSCRRIECDIGKRTRKLHVLSGSVLSVWNKVESLLAQVTNSKMQVIRLKTTDNQKIVGLLIPNSAIEMLKKALSENSSSVSF